MKLINSTGIRSFILAVFAVSLLWPASVTAAPAPKSGKSITTQKDRLIEEILQISGIEDSIDRADGLFIDTDQLQKTDLPYGRSGFVKSVMARVYQQDEVRQAIREQFQRKYNPKHVQKVLQWYRTPLAAKVTKMELTVLSPYTHRRTVKYLKELEDGEMKTKRLKLFKHMDQSVGYADFRVEALKIFAGMLFPYDENYRGKQVGAVIGSLNKELDGPERERVLNRLLYVYRDLADEELMAYSRFVQSAAGKWFYKTLFDGSETGLTMVGIRVKDYQKSLYAEVNAKGADYKMLKEIAPPGNRFSLIRKRDPFAPLVIDGVLQVARKPKIKTKTTSRSKAKTPKEVRGYGRELRSSPNIPWEVYKSIKLDDPDLYADLESYSKLFQDRKKLKAMSKSEYRRALSRYRALLARANEKKLMPTPLQTGYSTIKLVGVIWKNQEMVALVEVKGSAGHAVKKGVLIGPNYGIVESIRRDEIVVVERSRDYLGNILTTKKLIEFQNQGSQEEG
jgi:hypothetical protein